MNYDMIQSTLTLVIEAAVFTLPALWLHYLYSSGRCPKELREVSEGCSTPVRELSESNVVELRKNFVEHLLEQPIQIPDFQPLSREAAHEREQVSEKLSDSFYSEFEEILSNTSRTPFGQLVEQSWFSRVKRYRLHGYDVVKVADIREKIPAGVKRYSLRSQPVVRVQDLIAAQ